MKFRYPFLSATLLVLALVFSLAIIGAVSVPEAVFLVGLGQAAILCKDRMRPALFSVAFPQSQFDEIERILKGLHSYDGLFKELPDRLSRLEKENDDLRGQLRSIRKSSLAGMGEGVRWVGNVPFVSDDCATALTSVFVMEVASIPNAMKSVVQDSGARERVISKAAASLGMTTRTAMSGTEIPLPTVYVPQIVELVWKWGQARQFSTIFPLGSGTVKLPRLKAGEDSFGYMGIGTAGMSQPVPEKRVTAELVTFTANKAGGLIRFPTELEEDTFVPIGQFLARYIARQLAQLEDKTMFLADGTASYANQTGVGPYCAANPDYLLQLEAGKTKPSDATLDDWRNMRAKVAPPILAGLFDAAYYINPTFEPFLRSFNKYPNFIIFDNQNGQPRFDGWPVRWIGASQAYATAAAPAKFIGFFGCLPYWYLGERGAPRVEVSREVFFATDELCMRALERIDVEAMAVDAMAALQTAAS